jgi:hypothetical protein
MFSAGSVSAPKTRQEKSIRSLILVLSMEKSKLTKCQSAKAFKEYEGGCSMINFAAS